MRVTRVSHLSMLVVGTIWDATPYSIQRELLPDRAKMTDLAFHQTNSRTLEMINSSFMASLPD